MLVTGGHVGPGALSALSELQLEQLFYVCTGLSPKVHVKNLIVDTKNDLCFGSMIGGDGWGWWWPKNNQSVSGGTA